jgi:cell division protease FtsH
VSLERDRQPLFLPAAPPMKGDYSEETAREIDCEIRRLIDEQHARAADIVGAHRDHLREAAALLLQKETMTGAELREIVARPATRYTRTA